MAVIVNLKDGLGNQMFQYALGHVLSKKNKIELKLDLRVFEEKKINPIIHTVLNSTPTYFYK